MNSLLLELGVIGEPLEWLLYQLRRNIGFCTFIHAFYASPIFNSMMRIDKSIIEAAQDMGANSLQILINVIIPLCLPGIAIGTIFVVSLIWAIS